MYSSGVPPNWWWKRHTEAFIASVSPAMQECDAAIQLIIQQKQQLVNQLENSGQAPYVCQHPVRLRIPPI